MFNIYPNHLPAAHEWKCELQSVDVVKGFTRISAAALFVIAASELDVNDPACQEKLKPLFKVLDKEKDFCVPGDAMLSHSERRNLTDLQETSQWLGGLSVPKMVLKSLMSWVKNSFGTVVIHPTAYDGCLEQAGYGLGLWVVSSSAVEMHYKAARDAAWKGNQFPMDKQTQKYRKEAASDQLPQAPEKPTMKLCQLTDDCRLSIPSDIRAHFLHCPIYGMEWREILKKFDQDWGAAAAAPTPSTPASQGGQTPSPAAKAELKQEAKLEMKLEPGFDWSKAFPGSPTTLTDLRAKFPNDVT
eukprot:Skav211095  [mRNA]  locus=scaffold2002:390055:394244:+ [translate_table: standard]